MDTKPKEIAIHEWEEIRQLQEVIDGWGLYPFADSTELSAEEWARSVYGVKYDFISGGPGYCGDMFILMGDALSGNPMLIIRDDRTKELKVVEPE